jgi:hypothetical protein
MITNNEWFAIIIVCLMGFLLSAFVVLIKLRELIRDELKLFFEEG